MPEAKEPDEQPPSPSFHLATFAPLVLAATAVAGALAFFMGWQYEKAYLEE